MVVGCLELALHIEHSHSLKEKRSVVRRTVDRIRSRFGVAVAETGDNDLHQRARIGVVAVSNDAALVNSILDKVKAHVEDDLLGRAELVDARFELIHW